MTCLGDWVEDIINHCKKKIRRRVYWYLRGLINRLHFEYIEFKVPREQAHEVVW